MTARKIHKTSGSYGRVSGMTKVRLSTFTTCIYHFTVGLY